ncbi:Dirigent protein 3 [Linum perenne]
MAAKLTLLCFLTITLLISSTSPSSAAAQKTHTTDTFSFATKLSRAAFGLDKEEKLTRLRFYMSDIFGGENATSIPVTNVLDNNTFYGLTMVDNPLTLDPDLNSTTVGRARGMYGVASKTEIDFMMVLNFVFSEGEYRGSTFSLLGHNAIFAGGEREMPVVGGTGVFRFGRGHAHAETYSLDTSTGNTIVEYNVYVVHY